MVNFCFNEPTLTNLVEVTLQTRSALGPVRTSKGQREKGKFVNVPGWSGGYRGMRGS